jgi:iron complex transport system permease protein
VTATRWVALMAALLAAVGAGLAGGSTSIPLADVVVALTGGGEGHAAIVIRELRLPRVLLAMLVGASLGVAGGALQGALRNPLAEPYLLGVSGGAAVGAVVATIARASQPVVTLAAFAGGVGAVVLALGVARAGRSRGDPRVLLMAGVIVGAFANAVIMVALASARPDSVRNALWWMMGSAADASWSQVATLGAHLVVGSGVLLWLARRIDLLSLGEESAAGLGIDTDGTSRRVYLAAAFVAAASVAAAGLVGFVGLIVPHIARALGCSRHRPLIVACAMIGGAMVVGADLVARIARPPAELPLGAVTALIGVPFFLAQLRRMTT